MSLQEKFQVTLPGKENGGEPWADVKSARVHHGVKAVPDMGKMNQMPPGYEAITPADNFQPLSLAGQTDVTDTISGKGLKDGFIKKPMKGTDDQYTGEHVDPFYEDLGGFVERANVLDRM